METNYQIRLRDITKKYRLYKSDNSRLIDLLFPLFKRKYELFTALDQISIDVRPGEILGVIGRNGSGKSTLLRVIAGITAPTSGELDVKGRVIPLFELGAGFHRELTGRENLYYYTVIQDFNKHRAEEIINRAIEFADIGRFIDQPLRTYSRGMRSRLAFSISIFLDADILVIDEVLAVGDVYFKQKSHKKMRELLTSGKTIIMVSHSEKEIRKVCTRAVLMHKGKFIIDGKPDDVIKAYKPKKLSSINSMKAKMGKNNSGFNGQSSRKI